MVKSATQAFRVGLMFSTSGPYSTIGQSMLRGAVLGIDECNASGGAVLIEPVAVDPGGSLENYASASTEMLRAGIRNVVGCYTSSSRKEVIPCFEKHDALLWYPSHYEGFETSENVVYTGAAPNQHILPLADHLLDAFGDRAFCIGSNYIWAWENNRIMREVITARGGSVIAERYLPIGESDLAATVEAILKAMPSFVFSSLIGSSAYAFFRQFRAACRMRGIDQPAVLPVASCNLSEPELREVGAGANDGHLSSSVYFSTIESATNRAFVDTYARAYPDQPVTSADAEASYIAAKLLGQSLADAGSDHVMAVKSAVTARRFAAPQGEVTVDGATLHCFLTPRIGRSRADGLFDIIMEERTPVRPDPYLVRSSPRWSAAPPVLGDVS